MDCLTDTTLGLREMQAEKDESICTLAIAALQPQQQRSKRLRLYNKRLPAEAKAVSAVFGVEQLVHPLRCSLVPSDDQ
jgi:hypothetical protein